MRPPSPRRQYGLGGLVLSCLVLLCIAVGPALPSSSTPPAWWLKGRPRKVFGSRAEVELLSQLAVLLMPDVPIGEVFRDFPYEPSEEWGSSRLCPDFAAYGVLKATDAALFIEYDGYYRHMEPRGLAGDIRKTNALLQFAPVGSVVVRIGHKERTWKDTFMQVRVDCWHLDHAPSLHSTLKQLLASLLQCCGNQMECRLASRLHAFPPQIDGGATTFALEAEVAGMSNKSGLEVQEFLRDEIQMTTAQIAKAIARFPKLPDYSIDANLKPTVEWIKGLGLSQSQVAKVILVHPQVLGLSIEANLKPTVEWIKGLGLSQCQVAKVILVYPQVLGLSIEANLKPTVEWIKGVGLSQSQVAKVILVYPQVLGMSTEANLKPTVEWIKGVGLSQSQVAKVILVRPQVLGLSIEANLKPTVEWIKGLGLSQPQLSKLISLHPQLLGYSIEANLKPTVEWIKGLGLSKSQVAKVIATFPQVLGLSTDANLNPKVKWIKGLGLSQSQIASVIASFPQVLGLSIEANLKLKHNLLHCFFLGADVVKLLARAPRLWSYRLARLEHRLQVLKSRGQLSRLVSAMSLNLDDFNRKFPNPRLQTDHQLLENKSWMSPCTRPVCTVTRAICMLSQDLWDP
ncbi:unnamed protein product, partial [Symbiodinium sp. CCMP2456]